jgi:hypothetical protein
MPFEIVEQDKTAPAERNRATDAQPQSAITSVDRLNILNGANTAIKNSLKTLNALQPDGNPLSESAKKVFQAAIDASERVTPAIIDAQKQALYSNIAGWNQDKETKYLTVQNNLVDAQNYLSPSGKQKLNELPQGPSEADAIASMVDKEPSAKRFITALQAKQDFYNNNPEVQKREGLDLQFQLLERLNHGSAFASAVYAQALSQTGNAKDLPQAKSMMTKAGKDINLIDAISDIQPLYDKTLGLDAQTHFEKAIDQLDKKVPGWAETKAALATVADQSLTSRERMVKAIPLFETALSEAKSYNPASLQSGKVEDLTAHQGMHVSELYAQALTQTATDVRTQANREPEKSSRLNAEANAMTERATTVLKTLVQTNSTLGETEPAKVELNRKRLQEEIAQANRGEAVNLKTAGGISGATAAMDTMDHAFMGKKNLDEWSRPLTSVLNPIIDGLNYAGQVPYIGIVPRIVSDGVTWPMHQFHIHAIANEHTPTAINDLAAAKIDNPVAAKAIVEKKEDSLLQSAVSLASDLASGQIGVQAAKWAPTLLAKLPQLEETAFKAALESGNWKVKLGAVVIAGVGAAFGSRWAADELSHVLLGSKRMSAAELAAHSTAAMFASYTARGLSSSMKDVEGQRVRNSFRTAFASSSTSAVFSLGEVNPFITNRETGANYTATDILMNMGENSIFGGVGGVATRAIGPYLKTQGTLGVNHLFKSDAGIKSGEKAVESKYFSALTSTSAKAITGRAVGGFAIGAGGELWAGKKEDEHGNALSWGQRTYDAGVSGLMTGGIAAVAPPLAKFSLTKTAIPFNAFRRGLGRGAEFVGDHVAGEGTFLGDTIGKPLTVLNKKVATPETKQYVQTHALQLSTTLSGFYEDYKIGQIDRQSDARAEELRQERAAKQ